MRWSDSQVYVIKWCFEHLPAGDIASDLGFVHLAVLFGLLLRFFTEYLLLQFLGRWLLRFLRIWPALDESKSIISDNQIYSFFA